MIRKVKISTGELVNVDLSTPVSPGFCFDKFKGIYDGMRHQLHDNSIKYFNFETSRFEDVPFQSSCPEQYYPIPISKSNDDSKFFYTCNTMGDDFPVYSQNLENLGTPSKMAFQIRFEQFFILSPDGKYALIFKKNSGSQQLQVVDLSSEVSAYLTVHLEAHLDNIISTKLSNDGKLLYIITQDTDVNSKITKFMIKIDFERLTNRIENAGGNLITRDDTLPMQIEMPANIPRSI